MVGRARKTIHFFCMSIGLILIIPGCSTRHSPAPIVDIKTTIPLSQRIKNNITTTNYIVQQGETLYSIAWRADTEVKTLARINNLAPPYNIFPGQKIFLSEKSAQPREDKEPTEKLNKSSGLINGKVHKKAVAPTKKQEYGKTVGGEKLSKNNSSQDTIASSKIRKWQWPATGKVIATFSTAQQGNKGIDISGQRGDEVVAAATGKVVYAGDALRGYGNLIIIKHNDDYLSAYAHNDKILVKEQQIINAGELIARMGSTESQSVMLHFEVRFRGKSVDPLKYLPK